MTMENAEEIFQSLDDFCKRKFHTIPSTLEDYLVYVAQTGDPVFQWALVKHLIKEKLLNVIKDFIESSPGVDVPPCPNVDPFNFDVMKSCLLERLDMFPAAPFTIQRICELLSAPRKQYSRIDKFMRAMEKNILVVSTREPGPPRQLEYENGDHTDSMVNGSDSNSEYNVDVEMEEPPWKETLPQAASIGLRNVQPLDVPMQIQDEINSNYESVTPPESDSSSSDSTDNIKMNELMEDSNEETSIKLVSVSHSDPPTPGEHQESVKDEMCEIKAVLSEQTSVDSRVIPKIVVTEHCEVIKTKSIDTTVTPVNVQTESSEIPSEHVKNIEEQHVEETNIDVPTDKSDSNIELNEESNSPNFSENTDSSSSDSDKITNHLQDTSDNELSLDGVLNEKEVTNKEIANVDDVNTDKFDEFAPEIEKLNQENKLSENENYSDADIGDNELMSDSSDTKQDTNIEKPVSPKEPIVEEFNLVVTQPEAEIKETLAESETIEISSKKTDSDNETSYIYEDLLTNNDPDPSSTESVEPIVNEVSPNVNEISPIINEVSPNINEVSPNINEVSPNINEVSPNINEVSLNVNEVSPTVNEETPIDKNISEDLEENLVEPEVLKEDKAVDE